MDAPSVGSPSGLDDPTSLRVHAFLVSRGVRLVAEVGLIDPGAENALRAMTLLEASSAPGAVPFVVPDGRGAALAGYAAFAWAIDLYRWTLDLPDEKQRARILGLLHGYGGEAIRNHEERECGRVAATSSGVPESS